ncbi:MAG: hypothetical protein A2987_04980 [Omnitrophica bacterium RIFCSPLOWO2_01_FULL_45_10]|nr:MAG: hypothetical protein A2987_04980 [Omnitrophica bacterium RIFCSPLOWO2_01_FULL_45_10]
MSRIGLVAGSGKLPLVFSKIAKEKGDTVIAFGIKGITEEGIEECVDKIHWLKWGELQKAVILLAVEKIRKIILLGKVKKEIFFSDPAKGGGTGLDETAKNLLNKIGDKKDYSILNEITRVLAKVGIEVMDVTAYLKEIIPTKGILTRKTPTEKEWEDINYGHSVGKGLSGFDIGQTVAVKDKIVIALEAMEGTDETLARAGRLVNGGFAAVKVARPEQDMRFDVPLVGLDTLNTLAKARGSVLAVEGGKTLLLDKEEIIKLADEKGIAVVVI